MQFLNSFASQFRRLRLGSKQAPSLHRFSSSPILASNARLLFIEFLWNRGFQKSQAISIANRFPRVKSLERPRSVVEFFKNLGFSDNQIRNSIRVLPQIVFCNPEKTLKPKIRFLEEIGLLGSDLAHFLSKNSWLLAVSLQRKLVPSAEILKTVLSPNDNTNKELIRVLSKCSWLLNRNPDLFLLPNISFLRSCGIVGSQLAFLLKRQPRLFVLRENKLKVYVSRALDLGFSVDSRMLVHAVLALSNLSEKTFNRKIQMCMARGFSEDQTREMIRRAPALLGCAEEKLTLGMEFYMNTLGFKREALVKRPSRLMYSLEDRVMPRFNVLQALKAKGLLKKNPSFAEVVELPEEDFLKRFISRFGEEHTEALLVAYKGHLVDDSSCSSDG